MVHDGMASHMIEAGVQRWLIPIEKAQEVIDMSTKIPVEEPAQARIAKNITKKGKKKKSAPQRKMALIDLTEDSD